MRQNNTEPLFLKNGISLWYHTSPYLPNTATVHGMKACYFGLGTKLDQKGRDNKKELLEKHETDFFFDRCKSAPVFTHIKVTVHTRSCKHSPWAGGKAAANFEVLWRV